MLPVRLMPGVSLESGALCSCATNLGGEQTATGERSALRSEPIHFVVTPRLVGTLFYGPVCCIYNSCHLRALLAIVLQVSRYEYTAAVEGGKSAEETTMLNRRSMRLL